MTREATLLLNKAVDSLVLIIGVPRMTSSVNLPVAAPRGQPARPPGARTTAGSDKE